MSRLLAGLLAVIVGCPVVAQEPKENKEKPPGVVVSDPAKLAGDLDFAIQGEYLGKRDGDPLGAQVIALGEGKFEVKLFAGGLPGAGWDGKPPVAGKGVLDRNRVVVKSAGKPEETLGVLEAGAGPKNRVFTIAGKEAAVLGKVERKSPALGEKPPKGAVVLFSGPADADKWDKAVIADLSDGKFLAASGVRSKQKFQSFRLHLEYRTPWMPGQPRASSGVFLQDRYKLQVLDNFGLKSEDKEQGAICEECEITFNGDALIKKDVSAAKAIENLDLLVGGTYEQGFIRFNQTQKIAVQASSPKFRQLPADLENLFIKNGRGEMVAYSSFMKIEMKQYAPKVNMCYPPLAWQTYDIDFTAAELDSEGLKTKSAKATIKQNGVVIYDGHELKWNSPGGGNFNKYLTESGSLYLQYLGDPVVFNNIWAVVK
ncbi:3-keto-disaccharide hydrolase [Zavarzinella formosa]|uniref:3-keto-disaccharide hydrolase n=1 Tax=Zavarzinella formosa TaxID=360055 RepID=UPI00030A0254|nr:DUF1080 domain-containing protein [Zavarzinella formosa]